MSYLINADDRFYLLDPVFSKRALIPRRYVEIPMDMEEIYDLIGERELIVLITHNHYDYLDIAESIRVIDDLNIRKKMIPGHWGTFKLGDEPPGYPKYEYTKIDDERVEILDIGSVFYMK